MAEEAQLSFWSLLKQAGSDWVEDKAPKLSAALAYYTFLSIAPLMVITIKILSVVLDREAATGQVKAQMQGLIGSAGAEAIQQMINSQKEGEGVFATVISLVILAVGASGVFGELQDSLDTIWEVKPRPNQGIWATVRQRLLSLSMVLVIVFLLLTSLFVSTLLSALATRMWGGASVVSFVLDLVVSLGVITTLFASMFKVLPDVRIAWRDVWLGAFITAALFTIGKYLLTLYFRFGSATSAYGAAGSLAAVLIWVYYSGWILFYGAEFTQVYARAHGRSIRPTKNAEKVTAEERAKQGMDESKKQTADLTPDGRISPAAYRTPRRPTMAINSNRRTYALAGASALLGAAAGVLGVLQYKRGPKRITRKDIAAAKLIERLRSVEAKTGGVAEVKRAMNDLHLVDRIDAVERRIRNANTAARAEAIGRPKWVVRLGEMLNHR